MENLCSVQVHPVRAQQLVIQGYVSEQPEDYLKTYATTKSYARRLISRGGEAAAAALITTGIDFLLGQTDQGSVEKAQRR